MRALGKPVRLGRALPVRAALPREVPPRCRSEGTSLPCQTGVGLPVQIVPSDLEPGELFLEVVRLTEEYAKDGPRGLAALPTFTTLAALCLDTEPEELLDPGPLPDDGRRPLNRRDLPFSTSSSSSLKPLAGMGGGVKPVEALNAMAWNACA